MIWRRRTSALRQSSKSIDHQKQSSPNKLSPKSNKYALPRTFRPFNIAFWATTVEFKFGRHRPGKEITTAEITKLAPERAAVPMRNVHN